MAELQKWQRYINGRDRTVADVLRGRIAERITWHKVTRPNNERAAFEAWCDANASKIDENPELKRIAFFCRRDFDLLDRYGHYPQIRRIVARDFQKLAEIVGTA